MKIATTIAAFAAGWFGLVVLRNSWAVLGDAAFLGLMFTQLGFIGHDAGHLQVFRSRRANRALGLIVADALIGLSFGWWVPKHNAHHAQPNRVGRDPDLGEGGVGGLPSSDEPGRAPGWLARFSARHQAPLFFALMVLRSTGMHVSGIQRLLRQRDRRALVEGALIGAHVALYLGVVAWLLSPARSLAFIAVQQATFSIYLGLSFAPNHKGMPVIGRDVALSYAERQVVTARNVAGGRCTTFVLGGLNYQIEHHLFPTMPRPNLARAQTVVRAFCAASGLGYQEDTPVGSFRQIVDGLRDDRPPECRQVASGGATPPLDHLAGGQLLETTTS